MSQFIIEPHFRLQEWVAEERGYFRAEGLDYEFRELIRSTAGQHHNKANQGAFQSIEKGREANVSCACHWTVNVAASNGHAKLYADVYSVAPAGVFVPQDSPVRTPADLAGVPISVGFQSGSHYATIQALEQYMPPAKINLTFEDGMLFHRMELLLEGKSRAAALFSGPYYLAEQLGFRKVIDTTFMIAAMIKGEVDPEDVRRFFRALRRAQRDIDLRPELYTHYYKNEFPDRFHAMMDTRRWGPGERIVFETYSKEVFEQSFDWIVEHGIFAEGRMGAGDYERSIVSFGAHSLSDQRHCGQSAFTIASRPSVSAAGPGCNISGDLISTMRPLRTAGISCQPGRFLIRSGTTFLPHHDARITSGAVSRTVSGEMIRSLAAC